MGLFLQHYDPRLSPKDLFDAHVEFGQLFPEVPRPPLKRGPKIRLGYVSGDFCMSAVAHFLLPLIEHHDRDKFEIFLYSRDTQPDAVTEGFRQLGTWRDLVKDHKINLAAIRADEIDILIDCNGVTYGGSPELFALRPAPIAVTFLGYPGTTGLRQIDYRLTDSVSEPEGSLAVERLVRLPNGVHTYQPLVDVPPPAPRTGPIVFGNLGNPRKINPEMRDLWMRILNAVPGATLTIKFHYNLTLAEYLRSYGQIDIALDTSPYNGTTTICDALWMGTPVVTLLGDRCCARAGASLLTRLGMANFIAQAPEDYVRIAIKLAQHREVLAALRDSLRTRFLASPLGNPEMVVRDIERFYIDAVTTETARPQP